MIMKEGKEVILEQSSGSSSGNKNIAGVSAEKDDLSVVTPVTPAAADKKREEVSSSAGNIDTNTITTATATPTPTTPITNITTNFSATTSSFCSSPSPSSPLLTREISTSSNYYLYNSIHI